MSANPFVIPEAYDVIAIGGEYMPGLAKVTASRKHKWDEKKGKGSAGSTLTYAGFDLAEVMVDLTFWEQEQVDEWQSKAPALLPDPVKPKALDVVHPVLDDLKIRSVVSLEIGGMIDAGGGRWTVKLHLKEYLPHPKPAGGTPNSSTSTGDQRTRALYGDGQGALGDVATAADAQEKQIAALLALAQKP